MGLFKAFIKANPTADAGNVRRILDRMGYQGVFEEMLEGDWRVAIGMQGYRQFVDRCVLWADKILLGFCKPEDLKACQALFCSATYDMQFMPIRKTSPDTGGGGDVEDSTKEEG